MSDPILDGTPWQDWAQTPIAGDASARRYTRLSGPDKTSAIMMQTPASEADSQAAFLRIARFLTASGFAAPEVLFEQTDHLILSDLGQIDMAQALRDDPLAAQTLYAVATDVLIALHKIPPPDLPKLTPHTAGEMVRMAATQYCNNPTLADDMAAAIQDAMGQFAGMPDRLALRDYHAENLIWRPDQTGTNRMGLLDFQDAFVAPAGYDLISLLRDARTDVAQPIYDAMVARFCAGTGLNVDTLHPQIACLGVQRNLRILGVFARLAREHGKTRYLPMLPRVWAHLNRDLAHPALATLAATLTPILPDPDTAKQRWGL